MPEIYLGIDAGTSSVKVCAFTAEGELKAKAHRLRAVFSPGRLCHLRAQFFPMWSRRGYYYQDKKCQDHREEDDQVVVFAPLQSFHESRIILLIEKARQCPHLLLFQG